MLLLMVVVVVVVMVLSIDTSGDSDGISEGDEDGSQIVIVMVPFLLLIMRLVKERGVHRDGYDSDIPLVMMMGALENRWC